MQVITIGRHPRNNIVVNDPTVGRHHAQIIRHDDGRFSLVDMQSKNGTYVNGRRVYNEVILNPGDVVQIGRTVLPWENYFRTAKFPYPPRKPLSALVITLITVGALLQIGLLAGIFYYSNESVRDTYSCSTNIDSQVLMLTNENVSATEAKIWFKRHNVKVIDAEREYGYYLLSARDGISAKQLIETLEESDIACCAIRNQFLTTQDVKMYVIDNFKERMSAFDSISHGRMVTKTMTGDGNVKPKKYNINVDGRISESAMTKSFLKACSQMSDDDLNIVNFSFGISEYEDEEHTRKKDRKTYIEDSADDLIWYANLSNKCGKENFVITKSMGNESEYQYEDALKMAINKLQNPKKLNVDALNALKSHIVLVAAKDTRPGLNYGYSNKVRKNVDGVNTVMVDISHLPSDQRGTSAAAPLFANWISTSGLKNAGDVMQVIKKTTKKNQLVSAKAFADSAKNIVKSYNRSTPKDANGQDTYAPQPRPRPQPQPQPLPAPPAPNRYSRQGCLMYRLVPDASTGGEKLELHNSCDEDIRVKGYVINAISSRGGDNRMDFNMVIPAGRTRFADAFLENRCVIESVEVVKKRSPHSPSSITAETAARRLGVAMVDGDISTIRALTTSDMYDEIMATFDSDMSRLNSKTKQNARNGFKELPAETIKTGENTVVVRFKGNGKQFDFYMRNDNGWKCFDYAKGGVHVPKSMRRR